jgi:prevent-host-death family protein
LTYKNFIIILTKLNNGGFVMTIMASADIRLKYNDVVDKCKESGQPIYLTKNGQGELVVMDIASFEKREQELRAQQLVLEAFAARLAGEKNYSLEESKQLINAIIEGK